MTHIDRQVCFSIDTTVKNIMNTSTAKILIANWLTKSMSGAVTSVVGNKESIQLH